MAKEKLLKSKVTDKAGTNSKSSIQDAGTLSKKELVDRVKKYSNQYRVSDRHKFRLKD
jgi:hypothetical protein